MTFGIYIQQCSVYFSGVHMRPHMRVLVLTGRLCVCVRYVHIFFLLSSFFPLTAHVHRWRRLGGVDSMRRVPLLLWPSPRLHLRLRCRLRRGSEDTVQHQVRPPVRRRNRFM